MASRGNFRVRLFTLISLIFLILIFAGCSQQNILSAPAAEPEQPSSPPAIDVQEPTALPTQETAEEEPIQNFSVSEKIPKSAQVIFENAKKLTSYSYLYLKFCVFLFK